nr:aromatic amino acid lyase [Pantoea ananatis]
MSLGTGAALKLLKTVSNVYHILAIEYLLAAQALAFHGEAQLASGTLRAWRRRLPTRCRSFEPRCRRCSEIYLRRASGRTRSNRCASVIP